MPNCVHVRLRYSTSNLSTLLRTSVVFTKFGFSCSPFIVSPPRSAWVACRLFLRWRFPILQSSCERLRSHPFHPACVYDMHVFSHDVCHGIVEEHLLLIPAIFYSTPNVSCNKGHPNGKSHTTLYIPVEPSTAQGMDPQPARNVWNLACEWRWRP